MSRVTRIQGPAKELSSLESSFGAEEGTRTPTPLRVHGPEPCASANSATSARKTMRRNECSPVGKACEPRLTGYFHIVSAVRIFCQCASRSNGTADGQPRLARLLLPIAPQHPGTRSWPCCHLRPTVYRRRFCQFPRSSSDVDSAKYLCNTCSNFPCARRMYSMASRAAPSPP